MIIKFLIITLMILSIVFSSVGCTTNETQAPTTNTAPTQNITQAPTSEPLPTEILTTTSPTLTPDETEEPTPIASPIPSITPTPLSTPTPAVTSIPTTLYDGSWVSNEQNGDRFVPGPILKFTVTDGKIVSLTVSAFPATDEWFFYSIDKDKPLEINNNTFTCSVSSLPESSGQGEFILEGTFSSDNQAIGTMKFPKGFFWVDFALDHEVNYTWTAHK